MGVNARRVYEEKYIPGVNEEKYIPGVNHEMLFTNYQAAIREKVAP